MSPVKPQPPPGISSLLARSRFTASLLALLTLALYWPAHSFDFINYDDPAYAASNPHVLHGLTIAGVRWAFTSLYLGNWHPLTWLSHMLDADLFGAGPSGPHIVNLLLHTANTVLLFLALRALTSAHWRSALVAALFACHPLHVESVVWISERKDVLSTLFGLLSLLMYARYAGAANAGAAATQPAARAPASKSQRGPSPAPRPPPPAPRRAPRNAYYGLALLFFALGLMSKAMLVTLPFVFLLLDYWPLHRIPRFETGTATPRSSNPASAPPIRSSPLSLLLEKLPFFLLSALSCALTFVAQRRSGAVQPIEHLPAGLRVENAFVSYARYLGKAFWPEHLLIPYPHPGHWPAAWVALSVILVLGISITALARRRAWPFAITGWFWFIGMLFPVIGIVQAGSQAMADRYTYLPLVGIFLMVSWFSAAAANRWRTPIFLRSTAAILVLGACASLTRDQLSYWRDSGSLFSHSVESSENNPVALDNLSAYLLSQGRVSEGTESAREALQINPRDAVAWNNQGHGLFLEKHAPEALASFRKAVELNPEYAVAWNNLGGAYVELNQYDEAIQCYRAAVKAQPDYPEAQNSLGGLLLQRKQYPEAIGCFELALRLDPGFSAAHVNLAAALSQTGRNREAVDQYQAALSLAPEDPVVHVLLADLLVRMGRVDEGIVHYKEALRIDPQFAAAAAGLERTAQAKGRP